MTRTRNAALLLGVGAVVALFVAWVAVSTGASRCGVGYGSSACIEVARSFALRVGLVAGSMTVVMVLMMAGLQRMVLEEERLRATVARDPLADER